MKNAIPIIQPIAGKDDARLMELYVVAFRTDKKTIACLTIQPGFRFSASIPRFFWRVVGHPLQGEFLPASLAHDALYQTEFLPRDTADNAFYELLRTQGVGRIKAYTMYLAVSLLGWHLWPHTAYQKHISRHYCSISYKPA